MPLSCSMNTTFLSTAGVPREHHLETLSARACMKNDAFLDQGHRFQRWVVGTLAGYSVPPGHPSAKPLLLPDRHIASIEGAVR